MKSRIVVHIVVYYVMSDPSHDSCERDYDKEGFPRNTNQFFRHVDQNWCKGKGSADRARFNFDRDW